MTSTFTAAQENKARKSANKALASLPVYHPFLPLGDIDRILTAAGFEGMSEAIYCGRMGCAREQVGARTWISLSWHKMEVSGRYEIVAYLS